MTEKNTKKDVRKFYDHIGWQIANEDLYQNAQYEDLRPVSREYIHRCHLRVNRHLAQNGQFLLDAGSGPVQYPEYLTYSQSYQARVCMDISIVALREARKRLGEHGLYVVADIVHLPFKSELFDGIVSLHTIHHVPMEEKLMSYEELHRTLKSGKRMVIVNGWTNAPLMERLSRFAAIMKRLHTWWMHRFKYRRSQSELVIENWSDQENVNEESAPKSSPKGTFVQKLNAEWLVQTLTGRMDFKIYVWRSVSVSFLRSVIYPEWGGRFWLKVLYWLEERFPRLLGRIGQYPLVVISKPADAA
jgi:ubiquinone/menaquinone biosynthesis C-methylase UbiE